MSLAYARVLTMQNRSRCRPLPLHLVNTRQHLQAFLLREDVVVDTDAVCKLTGLDGIVCTLPKLHHHRWDMISSNDQRLKAVLQVDWDATMEMGDDDEFLAYEESEEIQTWGPAEISTHLDGNIDVRRSCDSLFRTPQPLSFHVRLSCDPSVPRLTSSTHIRTHTRTHVTPPHTHAHTHSPFRTLVDWLVRCCFGLVVHLGGGLVVGCCGHRLSVPLVPGLQIAVRHNAERHPPP